MPETDALTGSQRPGYESDAKANWPTALLLMACFVLAQADKQVMGLLAVPVQQAFLLTDTQLGFLQGGAFAIAFAIGGLPIAHWLDRGHRIRIAALCVAGWSLATIFCGLAQSFALLLLFRAATAFAEAGLPPAAFSIFSQSRQTAVAARLTGTFMLAPFVGGGGMLLLGGLFLQIVGKGQLGFLGGLEGWRLVFMLVGMPGLILALALLVWGYEPSRPIAVKETAHEGTRGSPSYRDVASAIFLQTPFLRYYYLGLTCFYLFAASLIGWYPALLNRDLGLAPSSAGAYAGVTFLISGVAGTAAITATSAFRKQLSNRDMIRFYVAAMAILLPVSVMLPLAGALHWSLALYGLYAFFSAAVMASMAVPIQMSLRNDMLARGIAIFSLLMSALAGSAGPFAVGMLSDVFSLSLAHSLSVVGGASAGLSLLLLSRAANHAG